MKRWLLVFLMAGTAQAACPTHPGHILNGAAKQPAALTVICGQVFTTFSGGFSNDKRVKWTELYFAQGKDGTGMGLEVSMAIKKMGFQLVSHTMPSPTQQMFTFQNPVRKKLLTMVLQPTGK